MQTGDKIKIRVNGGPWLDALVDLASGNAQSLVISVDEGIPHPFGIDPNTGRQTLFLLQTGSGWQDIQTPQRTIELLIDVASQSAGLVLYTIYDHPQDFPDYFVVRRWLVASNQPLPCRDCDLFDTLEDARASIPRGLSMITRSADDDPVIRETWL